ncbi:hypothetical protein Vretimale_4808 [Volvox reticuliferus]|uniref:Uncharacterized protein n=1 Tax=Volvox reticuliferus TaxID=1737510 RepID=A0A8J4G2W6_9CHLO|nr:hypothetical protein Vretifemale_4186 [Volvox reticuliferus]GIL99843.1 hypothetical protein Vretimale_4808 [Volvox reticuliferus]
MPTCETAFRHFTTTLITFTSCRHVLTLSGHPLSTGEAEISHPHFRQMTQGRERRDASRVELAAMRYIQPLKPREGPQGLQAAERSAVGHVEHRQRLAGAQLAKARS